MPSVPDGRNKGRGPRAIYDCHHGEMEDILGFGLLGSELVIRHA